VLIGLGAGVEVWSVLGLPVLLLAPSFWRAFRAGVLAVGIAVALFLPFVLAGDFHMFDYTWRVAPESPLTLVVASGTKFTWALRLLQGSAALAAGLALTRVRRLGDQLPWVTALGIMLARLVLDPYQHLYYYSGVTTCAIIGAATFATSPLAARAWAEHKRQVQPAPPAPL
jgi:hypothetical protein